jgi:hypothetical protein
MPVSRSNSGYFIGLWGWIVAHIPSASECLVYLSIVAVGLQAAFSAMQICRLRKKGRGGDS